jgi:hypothetical protein
MGGAFLLFLTFVFGVGALLTTRKVSELQGASVRAFELRLGEQQERAAKAEHGAADAQTAAAKASETAAKAESNLAGANERAAEALKAAQSFQLEIAQANERAANANRIAEQERLARLQLEARLADRILTAEQQNTLAEHMKPWSGLDIDVMIWGNTTEIQIISDQLLRSLKGAGWLIHSGFAGGGGAVRGILVGIRPDSDSHIASGATELVSTLQTFGISSRLWDFNDMKSPSISFSTSYTGKAPMRLFIGSKAN